MYGAHWLPPVPTANPTGSKRLIAAIRFMRSTGSSSAKDDLGYLTWLGLQCVGYLPLGR